MIYKITPEHFGLTIKRRLLLAVGLLASVVLVPVLSKWIDNLLLSGSTRISPWHWTISDMTGSVIMLIIYASCWSSWWSAYNYSLEIDDNTARVGERVVRKGHVRYMREFKGTLFRGPRLELSEHGSLWVRFFGNVVMVPETLPQYDQIKMQVSTWVVDTAHRAEK